MVFLYSSAVRNTNFFEVHILHIRFEVRVALTLLYGMADGLAAETTHVSALAISCVVLFVAITAAFVILVDMLLKLAARVIDILLATAPPHSATPGTHMRSA
jgi:hypothetical protein